MRAPSGGKLDAWHVPLLTRHPLNTLTVISVNQIYEGKNTNRGGKVETLLFSWSSHHSKQFQLSTAVVSSAALLNTVRSQGLLTHIYQSACQKRVFAAERLNRSSSVRVPTASRRCDVQLLSGAPTALLCVELRTGRARRSSSAPPRPSRIDPRPHSTKTPPRPAQRQTAEPTTSEPRVRALWLMMETFEMAQKTTLLAKEKSVDDACGTRHCGRNEMWLECNVIWRRRRKNWPDVFFFINRITLNSLHVYWL